ncbi:ABC transporter ATP-binding protein [Urinicoccus timonensis]|uniref:ABC transporter ATP-binding protein n=1 Tax=Urinicoccus timonensis TaxID=2024205 RepID=UPI000C07B335|nr:ABC transporter ATP-binding protein [Urinicoccus timonensis]
MRFILEDIHKSFKKHQVLKGADMVFESGHIIGLLGRNGAGKTTLFQILNGELPFDSGSFYIEEGDQRRPVQEGDIGLVYSENILPDFLTGYEFIKFYLDIHRGKESMDPEPFLDQMEFSQEDRHKLIKTYSHGMKTKLSMLTLLIAAPPIMLLDEPLTSLDVVMSEMIKNILRTMQKDHIIILSTHMMDLAKNLCDEIVLLHNGRLKGVEDMGQEDFDAYILQALREKEDA